MDSNYICDVLLNGRLVFSIEGVTGMTRGEILDKAKEIVTKDRNNQYGEPENSFAKIAEYWSTYLNKRIWTHDVAVMMALLKIARVQGGTQVIDSYADCIGYMACGAEVDPRIGLEELENKYGKTDDNKDEG